jgi:hypothetical protein
MSRLGDGGGVIRGPEDLRTLGCCRCHGCNEGVAGQGTIRAVVLLVTTRSPCCCPVAGGVVEKYEDGTFAVMVINEASLISCRWLCGCGVAGFPTLQYR